MPASSSSRRILRVRELLRHEMAEILRRELPIAEVGLLTVNAVGVSRDLRSAIVFLGYIGTPAQRQAAMALLEERGKQFQSMLGAAVRLKFTPQIRFQIDDSIEQGNRVIELLDQMEHPSDSPAAPNSK